MPSDHLSASLRNIFGAAVLERSAARRQEEAWLAHAFRDARTRIVPVAESRNYFSCSHEPVYLSPAALSSFDVSWEQAVFLGEDQRISYFAVDLSDRPRAVRALARAGEFLDLKARAPFLAAADAARLAYARAMVHWRRTHRYCGRCGAPTRAASGGHVLCCSGDGCAGEIFPRTDPAIIVLVTLGDRILLARHPSWKPESFATLAGFVEPGESLEAAVIREVAEEVGLRLRSVRYHSSQPWPFPGTVMVGFVAEAEAGELRLAPDEVAEARWLTREELRRQHAAGLLTMPSLASISYRLIEDWLDGAVGPAA